MSALSDLMFINDHGDWSCRHCNTSALLINSVRHMLDCPVIIEDRAAQPQWTILCDIAVTAPDRSAALKTVENALRQTNLFPHSELGFTLYKAEPAQNEAHTTDDVYCDCREPLLETRSTMSTSFQRCGRPVKG